MEIRVLLIGKTGVGKSAFGNFLLGHRFFDVSSRSSAVTLQPATISVRLGDVPLTIVDTPGLLSNDRSMLETALTLQESFEIGNDEPHVFLIVLKLGRFTVEDADTINLLRIIFGPECLQHGVLIFTHEDQANNEGENIETLMRDFADHPDRKALLDECRQRFLTVACYEHNDEIRTTKYQQLMRMISEAVGNENDIFMPDFSLIRTVLERHVKEWDEARLDANKSKQLLMEIKEEQRAMNKKKMFKYIAIGAGGTVALGLVTVGVGVGLMGVGAVSAVPSAAIISMTDVMILIAKLKAITSSASVIPALVPSIFLPLAVLPKS